MLVFAPLRQRNFRGPRIDTCTIVAYAVRVTTAAKWGLGIAAAFAVVLACAVAAAVYLMREEPVQQTLLREGYQAVRNRDWDTAIAKFDEALTGRLASSAAADAYASRAWCYSKRHQREEALRDYSESIRLNPKVAWVFDERGILHDDYGEAEKAFQDFNEVIRLDPNATDALHRRARIFLARQEVEKAIADLKEAIRTEPDYAELHAELGEAQLRANHLDRAVASFDSALRLYPRDMQAYAKRAEAHRLLGDTDRAAADDARARAIDDENFIAWRGFHAAAPVAGAGADLIRHGDAAAMNEQYDLAVEDYNKAFASTLSKENASVAYTNRGTAYFRKGDPGQARADYDRAVAENPRNVAARVNRASVHLQRDPGLAIAECTAAIQIDPTFGGAYLNRAFAYEEIKDAQKAVADFKKAIELNSPRVEVPLNALAWLRATSLDSTIRDAKEAIPAAMKACELTKWDNPDIVDTLAAAYAEGGDFTPAIEWQAKAIKLTAKGRLRVELEDRLQLYRERKPYRE